MNDPNAAEHVFLAKFALVLSVIGVIIPLALGAIIAATWPTHAGDNAADLLATLGCVFCEVVALLCGIVARRHLSARIALIVAGSILMILLARIVYKSVQIKHAERETKMEVMKQDQEMQKAKANVARQHEGEKKDVKIP